MNDQPRPIWLTREQRKILGHFYAHNSGVAVIGDLLDAWDAAPADATEAISEALFNNSNDPGEPAWKDATSQSDEWVKQGYRDGEAPAVLRALGRPS